jgi:hypothetical protein
MTLLEQNTAVLDDIAARGVDLKVVRTVDFTHVFPSEDAAKRFAVEAQALGYGMGCIERAEGANWEVVVFRSMVPTPEGVTQSEQLLDDIAQSLGGYVDGWGFKSGSPDEP